MQTLRVDLILAAVVIVVFLIALRGGKMGWRKDSPAGSSSGMGPLAKLFDMFWGWADYKPKDWSNAPYKRGYR
jgi:hypothetical protein